MHQYTFRDYMLVYALTVPFYLSFSARSFEFYVVKYGIKVENINPFLNSLPFPSKFLFNTNRWHILFYWEKINLDKHFEGLTVRQLYMQQIILLIFIIAFIIGTFRNIISSQITADSLSGILWLVLHLLTLFYSSRFGSKLKSESAYIDSKTDH